MVATHEWDEERYEETLSKAFEEYLLACYGVAPLHPTQKREVKQAFLSGIHWLNTREMFAPDDLEQALRAILGKDNPFIQKG